ncbi:hypothetical protein Q4R54_06425, partial [Morganella morganii]
PAIIIQPEPVSWRFRLFFDLNTIPPFLPDYALLPTASCYCCVNDTAGVSEQLRKLLKTTAITGSSG